jgi:arylsulfatase A-like enzyme
LLTVIAGLGTAVATSDACAQPSGSGGKRPNILFIFSDDHAYQAISAYNDPRRLIETPHIDRLAREGMRFDRCLVPNSICGPSRASVLTGKYSHRNGFYNNTNSRFDGSQVTFPKLLHAAGYQTALFGKWHLVTDPTGFDDWQILPGQGVYYNPLMIQNGKPVRYQGYTTDIITELSLGWLRKRDRSKPFLLMCHHKAPHREWLPALRHLDHDHDRRYPEPSTLFDDYSGRGKAEHDQDMTIAKTMTAVDLKLVPPANLTPDQRQVWDAYYEPPNATFRAAHLEGEDLVRWKYQRYMHDYLGCVRAVDESVGQLLQFLDDEDLAKDTIVIYAADQGFYLGEHGWFDKRWIFEESLRTPLLVRWPGVAKAGKVNVSLVSNIDFAETILEAAGLPIPGEMQGKSLVAILKGQVPEDWRTAFYYQYFEYPVPHHVRPHYGVVTARYKLVHFDIPDLDEWELFDREKDPRELRSVYSDPAYVTVMADLKREIDRLRSELKVPDRPPKEAYGQVSAAHRTPAERPNILWLVAEDFGPELGCYGTSQVRSPNLDRLAAAGVRYTHAYTTAPVCSASRSAFMTGMYQTSIGAQNHRSHRDDGYRLPPGIRLISDWMRGAGYFTLNISRLPQTLGFSGTGKTDWNFHVDGQPFDSDDWADLKTHQPFFAQINFEETHRPFRAPKQADPAKVLIPPYYPDHPVTRRDWAEYLDSASELDRKVGLILQQLETDGLADSTIVVFMADHGQCHVRGKQFCYEEGLHIPLFIRWPSRFRVPEGFQPGTVDDRLIESIDLAPTFLVVAGAAKPTAMQGKIFLGSRPEPPRRYVFAARDRCDETVFRFRTVRDRQYRYIRNFTPERAFLQPNEYKERSYPVWNLLKELGSRGKLTPVQQVLTAPSMPSEELYDLTSDPDEIHNLADSGVPDHQAALKKLRSVLEQWITSTGDQGRNFESAKLAAARGITHAGSDPNSGYQQRPLMLPTGSAR